ncbi:MAG: hypothetical protein F4126_03560 [Acidimicrobiaceae bacterium]|nr:hypothetical protein [Acidimicrobiaceae bacterium]MXZ53170.1 hypothetical protein [Acidimicrobiaceae bacterium]MYB87891.1 hypothetical protein [Acidimicrobiaceae bacterium]MYH92770.1 hypothetical protein [Acidimicrobiaceae bacterium]
MNHNYGSVGHSLRDSGLQIAGLALALTFAVLNWVFVAPTGSMLEKILELGGVLTSFWGIALLLGLISSGALCAYGLLRKDNPVASVLAVVGLIVTGVALFVTLWPILVATAAVGIVVYASSNR